MANALATYVEKYILNPAASTTLEDDTHEETTAKVTKRIEGNEGASGILSSVSQLRIKNAPSIGDGELRYKGKKTSRKAIESKTIPSYDPELAKYFLLEEESDDGEDLAEESGGGEKASSDGENNSEGTDEEEEGNSVMNDDIHSMNTDYMALAEEVNEAESDEQEEEEDMNEEEDVEGHDETEEEDDKDDADDDYSVIQEHEHKQSTVKTFNRANSEQILRGQAVKNQCSLFDSLFEARIGLQKVLSIANQLPQSDTYQQFLSSENYPQYKQNLIRARKTVKKLVSLILELQELMLKRNAETESILTTQEQNGFCSEEDVKKDSVQPSRELRGHKRKVEMLERTLRKRHAAFVPFRDDTLNKWHERAKLLTNQNKKNFSSFEIAPSQQIKNILVNKEERVKRTQLVSVVRGNVHRVIGKPEKDQDEEIAKDYYDPEIFDDSDFYSRMLESMLKSKLFASDDMTAISRRFVDIQKLRRKAKKVVDTKASKGRKIRFEVMSKLQQFLAPCKPSLIDDEAINRLYASLFDNVPKNYAAAIKYI